ncbi:hypothetical protein Tco_0752259, partial [Tanacetum coccineum]
MTKVIKGEFEKIKDIKVEDDSLACDSPLEVFNCEIMIRSHAKLIIWDLIRSDIAFIEMVARIKVFQYKNMGHYTMKNLKDLLVRGDDEIQRFELISILLDQGKASVAIKRWTTVNLARTSNNACRTPREGNNHRKLVGNLRSGNLETLNMKDLTLSDSNVAFVSSDNSSSTNETVNTAHSVSAASSKDQASTASYADDVMFSFFANQSNAPQLDNEDLNRLMLMILKKWISNDKGKVECYNHRRGHFPRECRAPRNQGNKNRDALRRNEPVAYYYKAWLFKMGVRLSNGIRIIRTRIVVHEKNEAVYEENIEFLKYDVQVKDISIKDLKNQLEEALKEKYDLKLKLDKFKESSKNLTKLINNDNPVNDRFKICEGFHAVPPPYTGNYMPPRPDLSFARNFVPTAVATKSGQVQVNAAKQSSSRAATSISTARPVNTDAPKPKGNPQYTLQDQGIFDSGCSRHMTGNSIFLQIIKRLMVDLLHLEEVQRSSEDAVADDAGKKTTKEPANKGERNGQEKEGGASNKEVKTTSTPIDTNKALLKDKEAKDVYIHLYRSMIRSFMYLTTSRPDIMFAVCACARYLKGQPKLGLWYPRDSPFDFEAFSDSDYAGASFDRKSTTGGCQFLGKRLISWQLLWIQNQMLDYGFNFMNTKIHIDNESTICIVKNPVFHSKTKHIEIRHHFIRDSYEKRLIQVIKIHTDHNVADLLTKAFDVSSDEFGVKTGSCKVNAARQDLVLLGEKGNADFHQIVDFLNASTSRYSLIISPTIYASYIAQFWATAKSKIVNNETQIHATVDGKTIVISESSVRSNLHFKDEDGVTSLTNSEILENLALMGYEIVSNKLTFQKSFFSPQWKYLIHVILHCLSSKSTAWNEFSTNIASAVICLANNQKFNFSKLIFDEPFNDTYETPKHTQKVFANMRRKGKGFSGIVTPLFQSMLAIQAVEGGGSEQPSEPQPTPSPASPSHEDDKVVKAATTATSLEAEQESGSGPKCQDTTLGDADAQTRFKTASKKSHDPPLSK